MPTSPPAVPALAVVGGRLATDLVDVTEDLDALDSTGFWAVVLPFEGAPVCARFATVRPARPWPGPPWQGPDPDRWHSSLDQAAFEAGVETIREAIAAGDVYQINLTFPLAIPFTGDPLSHLARWRAAARPDDDVLRALITCVQGVSQALQNTG